MVVGARGEMGACATASLGGSESQTLGERRVKEASGLGGVGDAVDIGFASAVSAKSSIRGILI